MLIPTKFLLTRYDVVMRLWRIVDMLMVACQDPATLRRRIVDMLDKNDCYLNSIEEVCG